MTKVAYSQTNRETEISFLLSSPSPLHPPFFLSILTVPSSIFIHTFCSPFLFCLQSSLPFSPFLPILSPSFHLPFLTPLFFCPPFTPLTYSPKFWFSSLSSHFLCHDLFIFLIFCSIHLEDLRISDTFKQIPQNRLSLREKHTLSLQSFVIHFLKLGEKGLNPREGKTNYSFEVLWKH